MSGFVVGFGSDGNSSQKENQDDLYAPTKFHLALLSPVPSMLGTCHKFSDANK